MRRMTFAVLGSLALVMGFTSCVESSGLKGISAYQAYDRPAKLSSDPSAVKVKVSLSKQRVYVLEGSEMLMVMPVSVGEPSSSTPTGNFRINSKKTKHRDHLHGYASDGKTSRKVKAGGAPAGWKYKGIPMPYWCEFKPDYGFHTGWIKHSPCTNGCIRMHENLAPKFFRLVSVGTPVSIEYSQPEDAAHANIPLPPDAGPLKDYSGDMYLGDGYFSHHKTPHFD
jgi:L,D-transpeptidase catalytic domain